MTRLTLNVSSTRDGLRRRASITNVDLPQPPIP